MHLVKVIRLTLQLDNYIWEVELIKTTSTTLGTKKVVPYKQNVQVSSVYFLHEAAYFIANSLE